MVDIESFRLTSYPRSIDESWFSQDEKLQFEEGEADIWRIYSLIGLIEVRQMGDVGDYAPAITVPQQMIQATAEDMITSRSRARLLGAQTAYREIADQDEGAARKIRRNVESVKRQLRQQTPPARR